MNTFTNQETGLIGSLIFQLETITVTTDTSPWFKIDHQLDKFWIN